MIQKTLEARNWVTLPIIIYFDGKQNYFLFEKMAKILCEYCAMEIDDESLYDIHKSFEHEKIHEFQADIQVRFYILLGPFLINENFVSILANA